MEKNNVVYDLKVGDFLLFESSYELRLMCITEIKRTSAEDVRISFSTYDLKNFYDFDIYLFVKNKEYKPEFIFDLYFSGKLKKINKKRSNSYFFESINNKMIYFQKLANDFLMKLNKYDK